jgi:flagella basal body P-ring formation protein FlgA
MKAWKLLIVLLSMSFAAAPAADEPPPVEIYLPRRMPVTGESLTLGQVCIVRCSDAESFRKACAVAMGRAPWTAETIVIDRRTILSRLAASGVAPARVRITGAEEVAIRRHDRIIPAEQIVRAAEAFLEKHPPEGAGVVWRLLRRPEAVSIRADQACSLQASAAEKAPAGQVKVVVEALGEDRLLAARELAFTLRYRARQARATRDIPAGTVVTPANAKVEMAEADKPQRTDWRPPFGLAASQEIKAGTVIRSSALIQNKPGVAVKRGQPVMMKLAGRGFVISAIGEALQDGRPGEFIKVRNVDSRRVIVAKVGFDGTVEPVLKR